MQKTPPPETASSSEFSVQLLNPKLTFDEIIEKLGINNFNLRVYLFIALFFIADGSEMVVLSLLITKLSDIWLLTPFESSLGSLIFIGFAIGSLCSGFISDRKGRRPAYLLGSIIVLIFAAGSSLSQGFYSFLFLRIICGFGICLAIPALFALATELTPSDSRSAALNNVWAFFPTGSAFVVIMTKFCIDLEYGWRYILLFASFPCVVLFAFAYKIPESPRFHMSNGHYEKAFEELEKIIEFTGKKEQITITEQCKQDLISEAELLNLNREKADYRMLIAPDYQKLTFLINCIYFLVSWNYYGATYILPQIFEKEHINNEENVGDVYNSLLIGCLMEIPSCLLAGYLANHPRLGRVKTMILGFSINLIAAVFVLMFPFGMPIWAAIFKCSVAISFNVIYVYACEAYPTKIRSMGVGLGNFCTRFAAILTPFLSQILFDYYEKIPFMVFTGGAVLGVVFCWSLPFETYHKGLK